jgi:hypothetical protein
MAEGLSWDVVRNPEEIFARGTPFVETFGASVGAELINPMDHPMEYAEAVSHLNPRHPESVFKQPTAGDTSVYADRYAMADNGLPAWAAPHEVVINGVAHQLGIRDQELATTFRHDFSPGGHFQLGLPLEGANTATEDRSVAMAEAIRSGQITVDEMAIVGTDRGVGPKEGQGGVVVGYGAAAKAAARLYDEYPDVFGRGGVRLDVLQVRTHAANTREVLSEAALRRNVGSIVMSGSNIYGPWMRIDMATVQHTLGLDNIGFGAGPDNPKAPRTPLIWAAECAQTLISAAHLRHTHKVKQR